MIRLKLQLITQVKFQTMNLQMTINFFSNLRINEKIYFKKQKKEIWYFHPISPSTGRILSHNMLWQELNCIILLKGYVTVHFHLL